ncbi:hypothetical protein Avbf_00426 [Armadillidium vulgare]|nr:hypothetical protein Avbf_00426 [Armadillidium vulgare]
MEPQDLDDDSDFSKGRFNLRKRKASSGQESNAPHMKGKKVQYNYTSSMLQEALDLVHSQNISIMNAAKQYGIPRSTLRRYALTMWAATTPKSKNRQEPALTPPEEAHLVSMITKMSRAGKYVSTMDVKSTVQHLLDESQRVVFKDRNRPNAGWVQRFRKRHRNLQIKGSGYTVKKQTPLTKQDMYEWCSEITQYLISDWEIDPKLTFTDENRHRIFNVDEMAIPMNYKSDLIEENIPKSEEDYTEITILAAVSAAGECMQPLIIQKGEGGGHEDDIMPLDQTSYGISFSLSGKMNSDIFLRWLEAFDRELCEKGVQKPIIIFLDDIFAHFHISVFTYAIDNDIILLCIQTPSGQVSTVLQPVESELTGNIKTAYRMFCKEHYKLEFSPVSMDMFPLTFLRAWEAVRDREGLKNSIMKSFSFMGLVPFDPDAPVYADFPLCSEILPKEVSKVEKAYKYKEPRAKKTIKVKPESQSTSPSGAGLIPKVKIKKLDKEVSSDHYKIVEGDSPSSSALNYDPDTLYGDTNSSLKLENKWSSTSLKIKKNLSSNFKSSSIPSTVSLERLEGRQDGIRKCIDLMESFIPIDLIPVWKSRSDDIKNSSEIPYCMWKSVQNIFHDLSLQMEKQGKFSNKLVRPVNKLKVSKYRKKPRIENTMSAMAENFLI